MFNLYRPHSIRYLLMLSLLCLLPACQIGRYVWYNFADITDYKIFDARNLNKSDKPFFFYSSIKGRAPVKAQDIPFDQFLEQHKTVAFIIIQNDTIQYEKYFHHYHDTSIVASFSMAKSIISILIGCAIDDGLIKNINEPITNYIPELKKKGFDKVHIEHLLQMTSGIHFNESYVNPLGDAASFYYGFNLRKQMVNMKLAGEPGKDFEYISGNSQLLGFVLERALKNKTITQYLQEKLWSPMGMEYNASWSIDQNKNGIEKTFCCLNARAKDFAKIGRLMLNNGNWNGQQLVSEEWVQNSTRYDTHNGSAEFYQYQWWLPNPGQDFMAQGILGQYIYCNKEKNLIIVRLGKDEGNVSWKQVFAELARVY